MIKNTLLMLAWQPFQCPTRLENMHLTIQKNFLSSWWTFPLFMSFHFLLRLDHVVTNGTLIERYDIGFVWQTISDENSRVQGKTFFSSLSLSGIP